tara:strand:+ start:1815 stop:2087 length:273 start_codon:yes stop_codon:yes gene_type:complete
MMSKVFLYIYLTFIPPDSELARTIEVNLPMANIEFCEMASEDLQVNIDAIFDYEGDKIHVEAECVDLAELLIFDEPSIEIPEGGIEGVRG